jgi:hypothetical protein
MNVKNLNAKLNLCVILLCAFVTFGYLSSMSAMAAEKPSARNYRVIGADRKRIAIVNAKGEVEWEVENNAREVHDIAMLANGNVLYQTSYTTVVEMSPDKKIVWQYEAKPKAGYSGRVEIHSYQRLKNGLTMIAESGNARIVEVDKNANIVKEIALTVERPSAHRDTRMVRKLDNGNYLVCHEGDGKVREYDSKGKVIWTYAIDLAGRPRADGHGPEGHGTEVFGAIRMPNGNTMIAGGNNNRVFEVTPQGKIIWSVDHNELPGIAFAWMTTLQLLPNGNLIIGNTHAGPENPQLIEITRDKKVVWTFKNFTTFGNGLCATQVLGIRGKVIR